MSKPIWSEAIAAENARREAEISAREAAFNPLAGQGILVDNSFIYSRHLPFPREITLENGSGVSIPEAMAADPALKEVHSRADWQALRFRHDFPYWAATCVKIKDKSRGARVPFILNYPQRKLLADFERQRLAGKPIRTIVLKARQWGGSTLTQMYIAWIQCILTTDWNSLICTQVTRASAQIRGMYEDMLAHYPSHLWQWAEEAQAKPKSQKLALSPYQGQSSIRSIPGRRCNIILASAESQDSIRGGDYAMAHLSEVAFWKETPQSSPLDFIRSIVGSILPKPLSVVVLESTANGIGNYFQQEWERSERGESDKSTVFIPWYDIPLYRLPAGNPRHLWDSLSAYEWTLWDTHGCSLSQINWYRFKLSEFGLKEKMNAEFPTTPLEAFTNTGNNVFAIESVANMRKTLCGPIAVGEVDSASHRIVGPQSLENIRFSPSSTGLLKIWQMPVPTASYVVSVDVGGRSAAADWSVVLVMRTDGPVPEVVAQWRGHVDHDILTWNAARIASFYGDALLAFESNSLETADSFSSAPQQGAYILHELRQHYPNLYRRRSASGGHSIPGFHTNRQTKQMIITELIAALRDSRFIERDSTAADEFPYYQLYPNGSYGASPGRHDDCIMARAIALHVALENPSSATTLHSDPSLIAYLRSRGCNL